MNTATHDFGIITGVRIDGTSIWIDTDDGITTVKKVGDVDGMIKVGRRLMRELNTETYEKRFYTVAVS